MAKRVVSEERRRRRRPTRSGVVLSERLIVETALRMLREHGSAGLTARRLGLALDCDPSTLYRYFRGMDDLTLAIGDALIGQALDGWHRTGRWRHDLRDLGLRIHAAYVSHPQAAVLTASRVSGRANELTADEAVLDVLRTAGFPPAGTVRVYQAFIDTTLAFAALDAASEARLVRLIEDHRAAGGSVLAATHLAIGLSAPRELRLSTAPSPLAEAVDADAPGGPPPSAPEPRA